MKCWIDMNWKREQILIFITVYIYIIVIYIEDYVGKCGIEYLSTKLRNMTNLTSLNLECIFLFVFYKLYSE